VSILLVQGVILINEAGIFHWSYSVKGYSIKKGEGGVLCDPHMKTIGFDPPYGHNGLSTPPYRNKGF